MRDKRQSLELLSAQGFQPEIVLDIGAAAGTEGLYEVWSDAHYELVEPSFTHEAALQEICRGFRSANYRIAAAAAQPGSLRLPGQPPVPVLTVDQILDECGAGTAVVKIDVDGPEVAVLEGAAKSLARKRDVYIIEGALLDTDVGRFGQIIDHMRARDYEVFDIIEPLFRPADQVLWQVDLVLLPRGHAARGNRRYY